MTAYAGTLVAAVLLSSLAISRERSAAAVAAVERDAYSPGPSVFGTTGGGSGRRVAYAEEPSYDLEDGDGDGDYEENDGGGGRDRQEEREDQLDQDDPVSTVTVTAVRGSVAWLPCDIGGGNNDGLPVQLLHKVPPAGGGAGRTKDPANAPEDRAYMVLWFKHQPNGPTAIRHRNNKFKNKKASSGGKPLYSFDVRGRPLAHALKWSSDEADGGFGTRASFVVFSGGAGGGNGGGGPGGGNGGGGDGGGKARGKWPKQRAFTLDDRVGGGDGLYDNSSKAALRVANVTEQDAGAYRCRVDFRDSPTRNYRIVLRVTVPPDKMTIIYNGETEIDDGPYNVIGPVPEGSRLVLRCKVQGGKPKPRVQWFLADEGGDLEQKESFDDDRADGEGTTTTTKKLVVDRLDRIHANSTYVCLAGNNDNAADSSLRKSVLINMFLNVKSVRIVGIRPVDESENTVGFNEDENSYGFSQQTTNLVSGKWYAGECLAEGASPAAKIEWSIDGNGTLSDETPSYPSTTGHIKIVQETEHSSKIRFKPTPGDDGRHLRCRAWNPDINATNDNVKNKALLLNVQYPPIVKLSLGRTFDPGRIKTGDDVYFECKVLDGSGRRKQHNRIEWYHNNHPILQNGSGNSSVSINSDIKVVLLSAGTLVIRNVGRRHSGRYACQCSNDLGTGRSRPVTLRVQYAPVCADDGGGGRPQLVGVEKTQAEVSVVCRVRADPADERMQFEWLVWPGAAAELLHPQQQRLQHPSGVATAAGTSYVTTALTPGPRNDTVAAAAGLACGELVLSAAAVGVPTDAVQYADRTSAGSSRRPAALDTVSCRATNAVGRQQVPCLYHIVSASSPGPLTGCAIRLPEDLERPVGNDGNRRPHNQNRHHRRRTPPPPPVDAEDKDVATVSCSLGNDGGVRPVTYWLEVYESNVLTAMFSESAEPEWSNGVVKRPDRWPVDNVTGAAVTDGGGAVVEFRVNRKNLRLRLGPNNKRKFLSLSAYAANRIGRGPPARFGNENAVLLRRPWWWRAGSTDESSTKTAGPSGTSSTEWWIMLSGGDDDEDDGGRRSETANAAGGDGTTTAVVVTSISAAVAAIVAALALLWKRRDGRRSSAAAAADTTMAAGLIAANGEEKPNRNNNYSSLETSASRGTQPESPGQRRRHVYPNPTYDDRAAPATAPDITAVRPDRVGGNRCLVSTADRDRLTIPGPESCV